MSRFIGDHRLTRRAGSWTVVLAVTALALQGCVSTSARPGIFVMADGDAEPQWIGEPAGAPVWSPRSDALVWGSEDGLLKHSLDGRAAIVLSSARVAGRAAWSPDGAAIAFVDRARSMLVVLDADDGGLRFEAPIGNRDVTRGPFSLLELGGPAWSPDGSRLAFTCWDGAGDEVCVIGADGSGRRQLTRLEPAQSTPGGAQAGDEPAAANTGPPAWSPDGSSLAVAVYPERRRATSGVYVVDLERGTASQVSALLPNSAIAWFPDGNSLVFSARQEGRSDVFQLQLDGGSPDNLTSGLPSGGRQPAPAGDGKKVAVVSGRDLVVVSDTDGETRSLAGELRPIFPAWSPHGEAIAFAAERDPLLIYD